MKRKQQTKLTNEDLQLMLEGALARQSWYQEQIRVIRARLDGKRVANSDGVPVCPRHGTDHDDGVHENCNTCMLITGLTCDGVSGRNNEKSPEGRARIAAAQNRRWAAHVKTLREKAAKGNKKAQKALKLRDKRKRKKAAATYRVR